MVGPATGGGTSAATPGDVTPASGSPAAVPPEPAGSAGYGTTSPYGAR